MRFFAVLTTAFALFTAVPAMAEMAMATTPQAAVETPAATDDAFAWHERSIGNVDAPVTIVEYASLTCGHCAAFHELVLPHVKTELIDTGKARLVYRDFPLNGGAVKAAKLARCMPEQKYFPFVASLFKTQQTWAQSEDLDTALVKLSTLAGLEEQKARDCLAHRPLEDKILQVMQEGQMKYRVNSTPSFVFYDNKGEQLQEYKPFTDLMEKHFKDAHKH